MNDQQAIKSTVQFTGNLALFLEGSLDKQIKKAINVRCIIGGLCMAIPLWGIEETVYAFILWGTYVKISKICGVPFSKNIGKNIVAGFIVNLVVVFILNLIFDTLIGIGWIGSFIVGFLSIRISAAGYVAALKAFHGSKVKHGLNYKQGLAEMRNNKNSIDNVSKGIDNISNISNQISQLKNNNEQNSYYYNTDENDD